jgi:hypothetical protein
MTATEKHYTPAQVAKMWGIGVDTVRRMFRDEPGTCPFCGMRFGRHIYTCPNWYPLVGDPDYSRFCECPKHTTPTGQRANVLYCRKCGGIMFEADDVEIREYFRDVEEEE